MLIFAYFLFFGSILVGVNGATSYSIPVARGSTPFQEFATLDLSIASGLADNISTPFFSLIDSQNGFIYIGSTEPPGLVKIELESMQVVQQSEINAIPTNTERANGIIDTQKGFLWMVTYAIGDPAIKSTLIKISLETLASTDTLLLNRPCYGMEYDKRTGYAYIAEEYIPLSPDDPDSNKNGDIYKVDVLSHPMKVERTLQIPSPQPPAFPSALIDTSINALFFIQEEPGTTLYDVCHDEEGECFCHFDDVSICIPKFPGNTKAYKINLSTFEVTKTFTINQPSYSFGVADTVSHVGYWGSVVGGNMIKVDLLGFSIQKQLALDYKYLFSAMMDTISGFMFVGTFAADNRNHVLRLNLTDFTFDQAIQLEKSFGQATLGGVIDTSEGFAYFASVGYFVEQYPTGKLRKILVADRDCEYSNCMPCSLNTDICNPCPLASPVLCPSGHCAPSLVDCPSAKICDIGQFRCANGSCVDVPEKCLQATVPCQGVTCWDGSCKLNPKQCKSVESCPQEKPVRCADWSCAAEHAQCPPDVIVGCEEGLFKCADGSCRAEGECPNFNGCDVKAPVLCLSGKCVAVESQCNEGCTVAGTTMCPDGICRVPNECNKPFLSTKPEKQTISFNKDEDFSVELQAGDGTVLGGIAIPAGALLTTDGSSETSISVVGVADSEIRDVEVDASAAENQGVSSTVVRVTFDENVQQPFAEPVKLSFFLDAQPTDVNVVTLAYVNEATGQWQSQEINIEFDEPSGQYFGYTDHFTDFGILVGKKKNVEPTQIINTEEKQEESSNAIKEDMPLPAWGVIATAAVIVVVIVGVGAALIMYQRKKMLNTGYRLSKKSKGASASSTASLTSNASRSNYD